MTDRRATARLFVEQDVPLAVATDYCSSIHATSLVATMGLAAPWFRLTPAEVVVAGHPQRGLRAAASTATAARSTSASAATSPSSPSTHPEELFLAVGQERRRPTSSSAAASCTRRAPLGPRRVRRPRWLTPGSGPSTPGTRIPTRIWTTTSPRSSWPTTSSSCADRWVRTSSTAESVGIGDPAAQAGRPWTTSRRCSERPARASRTICKLVIYLTDTATARPSTASSGAGCATSSPCSTGLVVSALARPEWLVEIDVTAVIADDRARSE